MSSHNGSSREPAAAISGRVRSETTGPVLVTGGAGFVGTNVAAALLDEGRRVRIFDSLARRGVETNLQWLTRTYGDRVEVEVGDVTDAEAVRRAVRGVSAAYHFAAQVAVTTSLTDPRDDFRTNLLGTFNVLEALRTAARTAPLLFTSTNKVYGNLCDVPLVEMDTRWTPADPETRAHGISEKHPLDFHSPYGCSKGGADQYVLDYARSYRLPAVVFRMSCIYGPHQFGNEDQGWVAHFLIQALQGNGLTLYGDGKQVRDVLFVDDLARAMRGALQHIERTAGRAFNVGGGTENTTSLLELLDRIGRLTGRPVDVRFSDWRQGDQRYYVSDTRALEKAIGWQAKVGVDDGVRHLHDWLTAHHPALAGRGDGASGAEQHEVTASPSASASR